MPETSEFKDDVAVKSFALIGAAGYIAPRHVRATKDTGNDLIAALDKNDSVNDMDSCFPDARVFTEFERFDRHAENQRRTDDNKIDCVFICSPNHPHDAHIRFALRIDGCPTGEAVPYCYRKHPA